MSHSSFDKYARKLLGAIIVGVAASTHAYAGQGPGGDPAAAVQNPSAAATNVSALVMGETFTLESRTLGETRRINVYLPPGYAAEERVPVLYMPDGGMHEDFLHVAGLVQVSVGNGTMRPFLLVGVENTARRRDLTGPTRNEQDKRIAPVVGGSAAFRRFIRSELMPAVNARYRTSGESAIVGESLAGLFIVETFLLEPDLFDTYIAFDPSLWWNDGELIERAAGPLNAPAGRSLYLASSSEPEIAKLTRRLADLLAAQAPPSRWRYESLPEESHATIYHPAALRAFRALFQNSPTRFHEEPRQETGWEHSAHSGVARTLEGRAATMFTLCVTGSNSMRASPRRSCCRTCATFSASEYSRSP